MASKSLESEETCLIFDVSGSMWRIDKMFTAQWNVHEVQHTHTRTSFALRTQCKIRAHMNRTTIVERKPFSNIPYDH